MSARPWLYACFTSLFLILACNESGPDKGAVDTSAFDAQKPVEGKEASHSPRSDSERLSAFFTETFEAELDRRPVFAGYVGRRNGYTGWGNLSLEGEKEEARIAQEELDWLYKEIDFDGLSASEKISYRIFEERRKLRIDFTDFAMQVYYDSHFDSVASWLATFLTFRHPFENLEDAEAYISRLIDMERAFGQTADFSRRQMDFGTFLPAFSYPLLLDQVMGLKMGAPFDDGEESFLLADFRQKITALDLDDKITQSMIERAEKAIEGPVARGLDDLAAVYRDGMSRADGNHGVNLVPGGPEFYRFQVRRMTGTDLTPDEIHAFGLAEVERFHNRISLIMGKFGFEGSVAEFFAYMESDPKNFYTNDEDGRAVLLSDINMWTERARAVTPKYFNIVPRSEMEVRRVEAFREASEAKGRYTSPDLNLGKPGIFWANFRDMAEWPKHDVATLTFHEGIPGHHFQTALSVELTDVPEFQKHTFDPAFGEGWALYSERFADEIGLFDDPVSEFGYLVSETWRAARLVLDTGIHHKGWTREEAVAYMMEVTGKSEGETRTEIDRYFVWPGQALSYRMGMERILVLRKRAQDELGEAFDIRDFHDSVLKNGTVPLSVLEQSVENYIAAVKAEAE